MKNGFTVSKKALKLSVLFGLIFSVAASMAHFNAVCDDLRANVLRLHIIANSDSAPDQELKLKIRDEILKCSDGMLAGADGIDEALFKAEASLDSLTDIADRVARENGFDYKADVRIGKAYFETREYDGFTLPAGSYESLIVTLGRGQGKNWWCVIYPEVCIPAAAESASLSDSTAAESARVAETAERYIVRFKAVEIYENIKKFLKK